jgi:hypothetical protein
MTMKQPEMDDARQQKAAGRPDVYEITVQGQLDDLWAQWFEGMTLSAIRNSESGACTLIAGPVADQPALHGLLVKIRDLNLTLVSVRRINSGKNKSEEIPLDLDL